MGMEINNCSAWWYSLRRSVVPQKYWTIIIFGLPYGDFIPGVRKVLPAQVQIFKAHEL